MRHLLHTVIATIVCALICAPTIDARGRNNNNNGGGHDRTHQFQPQKSPSKQQPRPNRPGNGGIGNNSHQRPGNGGIGNNSHQRPGNNFAPTPQRPQQPQRPSANHRPQPPHNNHKDWGRPHGVHFGAPYRPMMPAHRPWAPPMRPAGLRVSGGPVFSTILGVALGTALGVTLNNLVSHGYNVTGYVDNAVYVADAMQLNMLWPNATLYYDNGGLSASEFFYSTPFYDINRYNSAYSRLVNVYGTPYSSRNLAGGGLSTTWWGPDGQFIQLQFNSGIASNGTTRYFTTLSFGN